MSSYADAAASSGPIGADRLPKPPTVKTNSNPSGKVETVNEKEFERFKKQAEDKLNETIDSSKGKVKDFRKELDEIEDEGKSFFGKLISAIKTNTSRYSNYLSRRIDENLQTSSDILVKTRQELRNPVVIVQSLVGISGIVAGYLTYLERNRINTDNKIVLGIHASVLTGLVLLDGFLFKKYYPKYDKKKSA